MKPWWYAIPGDSLKQKVRDTKIEKEINYVLKHSG